MRFRRLGLAALAGLAACAPALDWREVRPEGSMLTLLLPCRPASHARNIMLAGGAARWTLHACSAGGATWAVAFADVLDPSKVGTALGEVRAAAAGNITAGPPRKVEGGIAGATPSPHAGRSALQGTYPDGRTAWLQVAVFAKGTVVYQASAIGERLDPDALETFFSSLRLAP